MKTGGTVTTGGIFKEVVLRGR